MTSPDATIYADGAASPNPGPGGYGAILIRNGERKELSGGFRLTTNNRMEILAAIAGLRDLGAARSTVTIYSDSQYVVKMFNGGYARKWRLNGWMRNRREPALNPDLWQQLLELAEQHELRFEWIRGHCAQPDNERCDQLAVEGRKRENLPADEGYERLAEQAPAQTSTQQLTLFD